MTDIEKTIPEQNKELATQEESTRQNERYATPPVDIYEKAESLTVMADLPGVKQDGLSINVDNGILTIEGKVEPGNGHNYLTKEFEPSSFFRQFRIAEVIDVEKIRAVLKNGTLNLTLPKIEKAKPRQIKVEV